MPDASRIRWPVLLGLAVLLAPPAAGQVPVVSAGPLHPWPSLSGDPEARAVELGDVTGDGRVDVVTVGGVLLVPGQLTVHPGLGDGWFAPAVVSGTVGGPRDLGLADLDGDGRQDALVAANGLNVQRADGQGGFSLDLSGAPALGLAFLVLSLERLEAPFQGGVLVPDADLVLAGLPIDGAGDLALSFSWPVGSTVPSGTSLYAQHWCPLPGGGFVASNALQLWTP